MPQNALDNPLVLPMLGLLAERARHQYALLRDLRERYPLLHAKTSTVYTLVGSLAREGLVELGDRPDGAGRQQVSLAPAGLAELRARVEADLLEADPNADPRFTVALAYLGILGPQRAAAVLRGAAQRLRSSRVAAEGTLARANLPELHMMEVHFLVSRLEHDTAWLDTLAGRIERGALEWPP